MSTSRWAEDCITLQRHFSVLTKFPHVKSRFCGRKRRGKAAFDVPVNPYVRSVWFRSVAVGITDAGSFRMAKATLDRIVEEIKALAPDERRQLRKMLDTMMVPAGKRISTRHCIRRCGQQAWSHRYASHVLPIHPIADGSRCRVSLSLKRSSRRGGRWRVISWTAAPW